MSTRLLPTDIEAEKAILSICLAKQEHLVRALELVHPEHFADEANRQIFEGMERLYRESRPIDAATLRKESDASAARVGELIGFAPAVDPESYCRDVLNTWRRRQALKLLANFADQLYDRKDFETLVGEVEHELFSLCEGAQNNLYSLKESIQEAHGAIVEAIRSGKFSGVPTHLRALNEVIGGLRKGNLIVLGARPGVGKTAFAVNVIENLLTRGSKVFLVSAEMTRQEIASRLLSIRSGISGSSLINTPNQLLPQDIERLKRAATTLIDRDCFILDSGRVEASQVFLQAAAARQRMKGLDLIIADYLQILEGRTQRHIRSKADYLAEITKELKSLAKRFHAPVLALAQLNREGEENPSLRHFADTSQIEKDADVAMILYPAREGENCSHKLKVEKNRNGKTGIIRLSFDPQTMYFSEVRK